MRFMTKFYLRLSLLVVMALSGCYAPPAFKPITTIPVKPPKKGSPLYRKSVGSLLCERLEVYCHTS